MSAGNGIRRVPELERMRNLCYQDGKSHLEKHPESRILYQGLREECPHLSSRELVELFHLEHEDLVRAAAHRLEYNALHPGPGIGARQGDDRELGPL